MTDLLEARCRCSQRLRAPVGLAGARVRCPTCSEVLVLPGGPIRPAAADDGPPRRTCPACGLDHPVVRRRCQLCGHALLEPERAAGLPRRSADLRSHRRRAGLPWERPGPSGTPARLLATTSAVLLRPVSAFEEMDVEGSASAALLFALVATAVWSTFGSACLVVGLQLSGAGLSPIDAVATFVVLVGLALLVAGCRAHMLGIVWHVALAAVGGAGQPMAATLRLTGYATGATSAFHVLPVVGPMLDLMATPALLLIGLRTIHGTSSFRAAAALCLPALGGIPIAILVALLE